MKPILALILFSVFVAACTNQAEVVEPMQSPYAGQEVRGIKSLSQEDIEGLQAGEGTPFGGMAKLAELNGYPGPRHVLDMTAQMELTEEQEYQIRIIYQEMNSDAIELGEQIIAIEQELSNSFGNNSITKVQLAEQIEESSQLYGELRNVHLQAHLQMMDILTPEQIYRYNELRGYTAQDPCKNIPEGHPEELWRMHNNCD